MKQRKILVIRLSSLGDVVLSSSVWSNSNDQIHFLTTQEYVSLFQEDPNLSKVWAFDRKSGFEGWRELARQLLKESFDEVWDLHSSLRSSWLFLHFKTEKSKATWKRIRKERFRHWGFYLFKRLWPKFLRPRSRIQNYLKTCGQDQNLRPRIYYTQKPRNFDSPISAVMPSSKWPAKTLPPQLMADWIEKTKKRVVILGTNSDHASVELVRILKQRKIHHYDGVGKYILSEAAAVLAQCERYFGVDTGLAHLAEAVGTPATVFFGPTTPDSGFGPWMKESKTLSLNLICQPCGKDGRHCYRFWSKSACLKQFTVEEIEKQILDRPESALRMNLYRWFARFILGKFQIKRNSNLENCYSDPSQLKSKRHYWFHGASAGELEGLFPIIEKMVDLSHSMSASIEITLTTFSESGLPAIQKFLEKNTAIKGIIRFSGLSPLEGYWKRRLKEASPTALIGMKYEAWPDLWVSLRELGIPLYLINVTERSSLRWIARILKAMGEKTPRLIFEIPDFQDQKKIETRFPHAIFYKGSDPRWDRVFERSSKLNSRIEVLEKKYQEFPRPWGVLGSLWIEDLETLAIALRKMDQGTLWVAPHLLSPKNIQKIRKKFLELNFETFQSNEEIVVSDHQKPKVILINEIGILAELYSVADWAFVGGGFTRNGLHNTMEPAVYGIPVSAGPKNADQFLEVKKLQEKHQLTLLRGADDFTHWVEKWSKKNHDSFRSEWKNELRQFQGASVKTANRIWKYV